MTRNERKRNERGKHQPKRTHAHVHPIQTHQPSDVTQIHIQTQRGLCWTEFEFAAASIEKKEEAVTIAVLEEHRTKGRIPIKDKEGRGTDTERTECVGAQ